jgi:Pyruvate/2-oxoacid:ferredoxin oxidoreductase delta subunit
MNEKIKELAERAGSTHKQNLGVYQFFEHELEKFAELIVNECAQFCEDKNSKLLGTMMKQHFGVEV